MMAWRHALLEAALLMLCLGQLSAQFFHEDEFDLEHKIRCTCNEPPPPGYVIDDVNQAIEEIKDEEERANQHRLNANLSPQEVFEKARETDGDDSGEIYIRAIQILRESNTDSTPAQLLDVFRMANCPVHDPSEIDCSHKFHKKYRSITGICNNLKHPSWGSMASFLRRMVNSTYDNGFNTPRGYNGSLPSAREISVKILKGNLETDDDHFSNMMMLWGQFHDHDITLTPLVNATCKGVCENTIACFPIQFPPDDPRGSTDGCMPFTRSSTSCKDKIPERRDQVNMLTAYTDASMIYGSSIEIAEELRDLESDLGLLKINDKLFEKTGKVYMPYDKKLVEDCVQNPNAPPEQDEILCFQGGDKRSNEHIALSSMHTIFLREHNRMATIIKQLNPSYHGDAIYHETRKIMGAIIQKITYDEYLPKMIGPGGMDIVGKYRGYNERCNPGIFNAFATAAYRTGHAMIRATVRRIDETLNQIPEGDIILHETFNTPWRIVYEGGIDPILRGIFATPNKQIRPTEPLTVDLVENLFALAMEVHADLAALNIQRGRDHGIGSYNDYRVIAGYSRAATFDDLAGEITNAVALQKLKDVYNDVDDIDLFAGAMLETKVEGGSVGPTFQFILAKQFKFLRDGDSFWYENYGVFTKEQVNEIKKVSLARILCDNGDSFTKMPSEVFRNFALEDWLPCDQLEAMDFAPWEYND